jgi:hypothetical protein
VISALTPTHRAQLVGRSSNCQLAKAHRYWRFVLGLCRRLGGRAAMSNEERGLTMTRELAMLAGQVGLPFLLLALIVGGEEHRLKRTLLTLSPALKKVVAGEVPKGDVMGAVRAVWNGSNVAAIFRAPVDARDASMIDECAADRSHSSC